jgi:hypothetical protein
VGCHNGFNALGDGSAEWKQLTELKFIFTLILDRETVMGINVGVSMARKVLNTGYDVAFPQAAGH